MADLDRVTAMHPDAILLSLLRIQTLIMRGDGAAAQAEVKRAANMPRASFWHHYFEAGINQTGNGYQSISTEHTAAFLYMLSSIAELLQHQNQAALADMDNMLKIEDAQPWHVLAEYCFVAGVAGQLDMAELTCQEAIARDTHDIGQYDSLGFAHLRMKQWDKAIADYNKALANRPDMSLSLYGRGIARHALGDKAGGDTDMVAAMKNEPDIANIMKRLGA